MRSLKPCPCAYWTVTPRSDLFLALLGRRNKKRNFPSPRDECKRERHSVTLAARVARSWRHGPCYFRCECDDQLRRPGFLPWSRHAPRDHPSIPGASGRGGKEKECAARFDTFRRGKSTRMPLAPCGTLAAGYSGRVEWRPTRPRPRPLPHLELSHGECQATGSRTENRRRVASPAATTTARRAAVRRSPGNGYRRRRPRRGSCCCCRRGGGNGRRGEARRPCRGPRALVTSQTACSQSYRWSRGGVPGRNLVAG